MTRTAAKVNSNGLFSDQNSLPPWPLEITFCFTELETCCLTAISRKVIREACELILVFERFMPRVSFSYVS